MCSIASSAESTTRTASVSAWYSVAQSSSVAAADRHVPAQRLRALVAAQFDPAAASAPSALGRKSRRDRLVHEQRLGRVAHARALDLGVQGDRERVLQRGRRVHVHVAVPGRRIHDRHGGHGLQRRLQPLATARDDQVDHACLRGELARAPRDRRRRPAPSRLRAARRRDRPRSPPRRAPRSNARPSRSRAAPPRCRTSGTARPRRSSRSGGPRRRPRSRPSGTRTLRTSSPLASRKPSITSPTGSGSATMSLTCRAIAAIRPASSASRSISASVKPASRPASRSRALASRISGVRSISSSAIASSAASLTPEGSSRAARGPLGGRAGSATDVAVVAISKHKGYASTK